MKKWYSKQTSAGQALIIEEGTGRTVAVAYDQKDGPKLAAAPDLLEALEVAADTMHDLAEWLKAYAEPMQAERVRVVAEDSRAAIEKARAE